MMSKCSLPAPFMALFSNSQSASALKLETGSTVGLPRFYKGNPKSESAL